MRMHAVDHCSSAISRRTFLQAMGLAFACRLHSICAGFTAIADELARLFRWCAFGSGPIWQGA